MTKVYTYDGNVKETYNIFKNGKRIMETFMGEDDTKLLVNTLNIMNVEFEAEGAEIEDNSDIYEEMGRCLCNEVENFEAILHKLIELNEHESDEMLDNVQYNDDGDCIIVWQKMENKWTIGNFLDYIGYIG